MFFGDIDNKSNLPVAAMANRQTLRPKEGNPNVLEVFAEEEQAFEDVINAAVIPSFRPASALPQRNSYDDDDDPSQPPTTTTTAAEPEEKRQRIEIPDATPLDPFNMDALRRHTERQIALFNEPAVQFAAAVAFKIGGDPNDMLLNGGGDLLDPTSTSVQQLLLTATKTLSEAVLIPALVRAAEELLVATSQVVEEVPVAISKDDEGASVEASPIIAKKAPKPNAADDQSVDDPPGTIQKVLGQIYERIGARRQGQPVAAAAPVLTPSQQLMQELANVFATSRQPNSVARWQWNRRPENLSLAVVQPDLVEAMKVAHAQIRQIIPDVLMWHLITGSHVRGDFAELVASHLNRAPRAVVYPNHGSVHGAGVAGTRLYSSKWAHQKASHGVEHQLRWFRNVYYGPSEAWLDLQKRAPEAIAMVKQAERTVQTALIECTRKINSLSVLLEEVQEGDDLKNGTYATDLDNLIAQETQLRATPNPSKQDMDNVATAKTRFVSDWNTGARRLLGLGSLKVRRLRTILDTHADEDKLEPALAAVIKALSNALEKTRIFRNDGADMNVLYEALDAATAFKMAIAQLTHARKTRVDTLKELRTFAEEDKVELFKPVPKSLTTAASSDDDGYRDWRSYQYAQPF